MKQKRKVKSLLSCKNGKLIIFCTLGLVLSFTSIILLVKADENNLFSPSRLIPYTGVNDNTEVLGMLTFTDVNATYNWKEKYTLYMSGRSLFVSPGRVRLAHKTDKLDHKNKIIGDVNADILGGAENEVGAKNVTLVAGTENKIGSGDNSTVLGGTQNKIWGGDSNWAILVGGKNNTIHNGKEGNMIIGGKNNEINGENVSILGGSGNNIPSGVSNVIVGGKSIDVNYDNIFVYSPKFSFKPEEGSGFYLNVGKGLGINMQSEEGVASLGAVSFGDTTNNAGNAGEIGEKDGCLVQYKSGGKRQMLDVSERCANKCAESNSAANTTVCDKIPLPDNPTPVTGSCSDNLSVLVSENRVIQCGNEKNYQNVKFDTILIDYTGDNITKCENKLFTNQCTFMCTGGYHLIEDTTGLKGGAKSCFKDCTLDSTTIPHNATGIRYTAEEIACANNDGNPESQDLCTNHNHMATLMCVDGTLYMVGTDGKPMTAADGKPTAETKNYKEDSCKAKKYNCPTSTYNLTQSDITGTYADTGTFDNTDRSVSKLTRGKYKLCIDFTASEQTCTESNYHYHFEGCREDNHYYLDSDDGKCKQACMGSDGQRTVKHNQTIGAYKTGSVQCETKESKCEEITLTCDDGDWKYGEAKYVSGTDFSRNCSTRDGGKCNTDEYNLSSTIYSGYMNSDKYPKEGLKNDSFLKCDNVIKSTDEKSCTQPVYYKFNGCKAYYHEENFNKGELGDFPVCIINKCDSSTEPSKTEGMVKNTKDVPIIHDTKWTFTGSTTPGACEWTCKAGYYKDSDNTCKKCDAENYCENGAKKSCPAGYTSKEGASAQNQCYITCEAGTYMKTANASSCEGICAANTYKTSHKVNYGSTSSCDPCPTGYSSEKGASICSITCDAGTYMSTAYASSCGGTCEAGTYKASHKVNYGKTSSCSACSGRTKYSAASAGSCSTVTAGYYTTGCDDSGNKCTGETICEAGYYCEKGVRNQCPNGYTSDEGSKKITDCKKKCDAGTYLPAKSETCETCPAGSYCEGDTFYYNSSKAQGKTGCGERKYSSAGAQSSGDCKTADVGYYANSSAKQTKCTNATGKSNFKYYTNGINNDCEWTCNVGYYIDAGGECEDCGSAGDGKVYWTDTGAKYNDYVCFRVYKVNYKTNGATSIGKTSDSCKGQCTYGRWWLDCDSCTVKAPSITRENWTVLGWNTSESATSQSVAVNGNIKLTKNETNYYAITEKTITGIFEKGTGVSSISETSGTCKIRNTGTTCSVTMATGKCSAGYGGLSWSPANLNNISKDTTTTATCTECPSGYGSAEGDNVCSITCEAGTYLKTAKDTSCTSCAKGYTSSSHKVNYGSTSSCSPKIITITLDANGGTLGTKTFYYKYNTAKYYSNSSLTTEITSTTRPTRAGYVYTDYHGDGSAGGTNGERYVEYDTPYGTVHFAGDLHYDIHKDATLYAGWKTCTAGYYCPGDNTELECGERKYSSAGATSSSSCKTADTGYYANSSANQTACTNAPDNAEYTSNGIDNDCSWKCKTGYEKSGDKCEAIKCPASHGCPEKSYGEKCTAYKTTTHDNCSSMSITTTCQSDGTWDKDLTQYNASYCSGGGSSSTTCQPLYSRYPCKSGYTEAYKVNNGSWDVYTCTKGSSTCDVYKCKTSGCLFYQGNCYKSKSGEPAGIDINQKCS